ncbi:MAG: hypothetical protein HYS26_01295 [Candidatus Kaiserbacteria bacterium]|nr:MAG: hypothetical protein HYS26_01295 [Candidatus Kaiserbacteria bacterium]
MEELSKNQEKKSEFNTLDQVVRNGYEDIADKVDSLGNKLQNVGANATFDRAGRPMEQIQDAFFKAHTAYLTILNDAVRTIGNLETLTGYASTIREMGGRSVDQPLLDNAKTQLLTIRDDATRKLESIIHSPAGAKIIEIAEEKNDQGTQI